MFITGLQDVDWKALAIALTVANYGFMSYLRWRQERVLKSEEFPTKLKGVVEPETFDKSRRYGLEKSRFSAVTSMVDLVQNVALLHFDIFPQVYYATGQYLARTAPAWLAGITGQSILTLFLIETVGTALMILFNVYQHFVLEEKWGFNKQTPKIFVMDFFKSMLIEKALSVVMYTAIIKIIGRYGAQFVMYLWGFVAILQIVLVTLYPIYIQPLFNKFTPLPKGELKTRIEELGSRVEFPLKEIYVMDGSSRSSHSNAYFTGMPWKKRAVIYDTLIEQQTVDQVVAVMAHEMGHWAHSHILGLIASVQVYLFLELSLFARFFQNAKFYQSFGFRPGDMPVLMGFILALDISKPLKSVLTFAMNFVSRTFEYQADRYAKGLGYGNDVAEALIKLNSENLGTWVNDWLHSTYHQSHPTLLQRLDALEWSASSKKE